MHLFYWNYQRTALLRTIFKQQHYSCSRFFSRLHYTWPKWQTTLHDMMLQHGMWIMISGMISFRLILSTRPSSKHIIWHAMSMLWQTSPKAMVLGWSVSPLTGHTCHYCFIHKRCCSFYILGNKSVFFEAGS